MRQYNKSIQGKLFNYFQQRLGIKKSSRGWWRCDCPYCGGKYTLGISFGSYKVHCFRCDERTSPVGLLMHTENFSENSEAYKFLAIQQEYDHYESVHQVKRVYKQVELPEGFTLLSMGDDIVGRAARHYIKKRGFDVDTLSARGVGYCSSGDYFGYLIFPYYIRGSLVYYQGRIFMGSGTKMKNPTVDDFGISKSQIVYNLDAFYIYNKAYIVESITNSLTLGDNAGAINGKSISQSQYSQILNTPCEKLVIILDPDAYTEAIDLGLSLVNFKKVKVVKLPDQLKINGELKDVDVNAIGKTKTLVYVKKQDWQKYMDIYKLKLRYGKPKAPEYTYNGRGPNYVDRRGA